MEVNRKKQLSLGVVVSYLTVIVQCLSGVVYTPIILRSLGQSEYGIYSLCISFSGYLIIFNAGLNAAFVRFYVQTKIKDKDRIPKLNGLFFRVFVVLSVVSLVVGLLIGSNAEALLGNKISTSEYELAKTLFVILAFTTCATVINCIFSSLIIANERFIFGKLVNLFQIVMAPLITIPLLLRGHGSILIFNIKLALTILITLFNAAYCIKVLKVKFSFERIDKVLLKSILIFACAIVIQSVMDQLNWQVDKFILAWTNGTSEISIYSVGSTLNTYYIMIASAMSSVFIAEINRLVSLNKLKELSELFVKTSRLFAILVFLIMSGYCFFGKAFIYKWAGAGYDDSYYVGLLIMLPVTVSLTMGLGQDIVRAKNIHKVQILINIVVCLCNFLVSIPLAMHFGAIGSAFGTFLCECIICILVQSIYYYKVAKLNMKQYYIEMFHIAKGLLLPICLGFIIIKFNLVGTSLSLLAVYGLLYVFTYMISMWLFAMNAYEKGIIIKIMRKVFVLRRG
ncbi:lipopolysaccharide biosynthesis protein [Murimonas intestini]|uniref:O-antigen/teichoic acid export membrane protein n=1 Tax=Murimonas intestini TaxID=1337051 RepID=A0AB73T506_9FIRM|nr:oligosaccharide flippase family protein [Murimonas intestini]MCR1840683.1 oligosaccharide flippase family protein [Murimonas intestini]MCR1865264.1 oligosaccharide flippase family protein [Murimonas intestini]MCR1883028.1 oligosaccharide flippase family protein [Murimonas intestini]